jgi:hypothetical protein
LPQPRLGSSDADIVRASELQHAVERMDGDVGVDGGTVAGRAAADRRAARRLPIPARTTATGIGHVPGRPFLAGQSGTPLDKRPGARRRGLGKQLEELRQREAGMILTTLI